jgi:hypothetical protein
MSDPDQIGYMNPPKHFQFRKGKSGNPKGRPKKKKSDNIGEIIKEVIHKEHIVKIDNKPKKMTYSEVLLRKIFKAALEGDMKAAEEFLLIYIGSKTASKKFKTYEDDTGPNMFFKMIKLSEWKKLPKHLQKEFIPITPKDANLRDIAIKIANEPMKVKNSNRKINKLDALMEVISKKALSLDYRALKLIRELIPLSEFEDHSNFQGLFDAETAMSFEGL